MAPTETHSVYGATVPVGESSTLASFNVLQKIHAQWACRPRWRKQSSSLYHVFVGGLASEVDDNMLFNAFLPYRCITARAIRDINARRTKGYGFVEFEYYAEAEKALMQMDGMILGSQRIHCNWAKDKHETLSLSHGAVHRADPENVDVYIGNLAPGVTRAELKHLAVQFGVILNVKWWPRGSYAFVQYATHVEAVRAIVGLSRTALGGNILKASWGRHQAGQAGAQRVLERLSGTPEPFSLEEPQDSMQQGSAQQYGTFGGFPLYLAPPAVTPSAWVQNQLCPQQLSTQQMCDNRMLEHLDYIFKVAHISSL